jgi:exosortase
MKKQDSIKLSILALLTLTAYIPTFIWMYDRWVAHDTYYSHGFLVPFISIFLVWLKRESLSKIEIKPANLGWLFFLFGILAHALSANKLVRVYFTSGFSLIVVLIGLTLLFFGKKILRQVLFPILFLVFMVPAPLVALSDTSFRLKIFAAQASTKIINLLGVPAIREGSIIRTIHSQMIVEDPCSGIRSLIALIALGSLMAYFSNISRTKKIIVFFSSIPIAVVSNIIRIVALSLASEMYGAKFAMGWFHNTMGILVFVFAFFGLSLIAKLLE